MNSKKFPLLNVKEQPILQDTLHYMKMSELKKGCQIFSLPDKGKKGVLIERIFTFITEGHITIAPKIPLSSLAKNYPKQAISTSSLMLYGSYKNDLKTKTFFKKLIGSYFHFTAFGSDWLNERWFQGNPPTYKEFANYWVTEVDRRKQIKPKPKDEWKYINFLQQMNKEYPLLSKKDLMNRWKTLRTQKAEEADKLLKKAAEVIK